MRPTLSSSERTLFLHFIYIFTGGLFFYTSFNEVSLRKKGLKMFGFKLDKTTYLFGKEIKKKNIIKPIEFDDLEGDITIDNFSKYALEISIKTLNGYLGYSFPDLWTFDLVWINDVNNERIYIFGTNYNKIKSENFTLTCYEH